MHYEARAFFPSRLVKRNAPSVDDTPSSIFTNYQTLDLFICFCVRTASLMALLVVIVGISSIFLRIRKKVSIVARSSGVPDDSLAILRLAHEGADKGFD